MRGIAVTVLLFLLVPVWARAAGTTAPADAWQPVPPVEWAKIHLQDFSDDELDLPFFLYHFHTVANAVLETGPNRGFIDLAVWRGRDQNQQGPYNARVMENHLSLAFFYCTRRPWNPYFGSVAVRQRLEAMLSFLCDLQSDDGRFSEYGPRQWNLAATAFATKFFGETLALLHDAGDAAPIDEHLLRRVTEADRKAIVVVLTMPQLYDHGKRYSNQYTNVFAGAVEYLALHPDKQLSELMEQKFNDAARDLQSPCGYMYENDGPDFGYTLGTHHSNVDVVYRYRRDTPIAQLLEKQEEAWTAWLGYNLLRQPDGSLFVANRGIETRQKHAAFIRHDGALAEKVEAARAFSTTAEERDKHAQDARRELGENWGVFPELTAGGYSPYQFLRRPQRQWFPSNAQRDAAVAKLPYLARERFIHQRMDSRKPAVFTYVRRLTYYATFSSGPKITAQQRLGLDLLWSPKIGAALQSQTASDDHAWGTRAENAPQVYEAADVIPRFDIDGHTTDPTVGNHDLPDGELVATYPLGKSGTKTITFHDDTIEVQIQHPGDFTEQIPSLSSADGATLLHVDLPAGVTATKKPGPILFDTTRVVTFVIPASGSLTYRLRPAQTP